MKLPRDAVFDQQRHSYRLRFTCEDCAHFAEGHCVQGFPTAEHRSAHYDILTTLLVFCKDFELA